LLVNLSGKQTGDKVYTDPLFFLKYVGGF